MPGLPFEPLIGGQNQLSRFGAFEDSVPLLQSAIEYLQKNKE